jgi:serine/threonine protein kinase
MENESLSAPLGDIRQYSILREVGYGKFGRVFKGIVNATGEPVAIKILSSQTRQRSNQEIRSLTTMIGCLHACQLLDVVQDPDSRALSLILSWHENIERLRDLPEDMMAICFRDVLLALTWAHSHGIFHRDVKPRNIIVDAVKREARLIDWGLAGEFREGKEYSADVGTPLYMAPEALMGVRLLDQTVDIWAAGVSFAEMILGVRHLWERGREALLGEMAGVSADVLRVAARFGIVLPLTVFAAARNAEGWTRLLIRRGLRPVSATAWTFVRSLLEIDPIHRPTAQDALNHPYLRRLG